MEQGGVLSGGQSSGVCGQVVQQVVQVIFQQPSQGLAYPGQACRRGFAPAGIGGIPQLCGYMDNVEDEGKVGQVVEHLLLQGE
jgi:hypothetical protein